ncbi:putative membrane protein [Nocardioides albertanoniae]|uniref:Putative membrane protein n=1 Tax=Nocardioides albertanoniae TaxID=1175486 RepID=A0A543A1K5_9ACTN|nr:YhgE/Pip domain-containing protein [Nocardioides albertanoniae]TQL66462.1 putative membrane protein [Nocardioides albertanoniae]
MKRTNVRSAARATRAQITPGRSLVAAVILLPVIVTALALVSLGDRADNLDKVPAAVVNLDEPVTTGKGKDKQTVFAGRALAADLVSSSGSSRSSEGPTLGWALTDEEDAREGYADGSYAAVITIPEDLSRTLSGIPGSDPAAGRVDVEASDASSEVTAEIARQVARQSADTLGRTVTTTYLDGVRDQTGKLKKSLGSAADGAGKLADGSAAADDGAGKVADGARSLSDGASGAADGASQVAGGLGELASGTDRLEAGAGRLAGGAGKASRGADELADGAGELSGGLGQLERSTAGLPGQADSLAAGASQVSEGVAGYTQLAKGWAQACATDPVLAAARPQLCGGTAAAVGEGGAQADQLAAGASQVADGAGVLSQSAPKLAGGISSAASGADQVATGADRLAGANADIAQGAGALQDGLTKTNDGATALSAGADELADGTGRLSSGSAELANGADELSSGTSSLSKGAGDLATGLDDGAEQITVPDKKQTDVVADPVRVDVASTSSTSGITRLAPAVIALALWIGALAIYLLRPAFPVRRLREAITARRLTLLGLWPAVVVGLAQAVLLVVAASVLGADLDRPVAAAGIAGLAGVVFVAVHQTTVALAGQRRGWLFSLAFLALQVVSLGGLLPTATASGPFAALSGVLPVPLAAEALSGVSIAQSGAAVGGPVAGLVLWLIGASALSVFAASRAQRTSVAEIRGGVAAVS